MLIAVLLISLILTVPYLIIHRPRYYQGEAISYLLILGCPSNGDGTLSKKQRQRIDTCIHVMNDTHINSVIISGSAVQNEFCEAEIMAKALRAQFTNCHIVKESKARNTFQNFQYTKQQYEKENILVVTSAAHCRRAYFFAKKFYSQAYMARAVEKDTIKDYLIEYFRLWNVLYWEVRLRLCKPKQK